MMRDVKSIITQKMLYDFGASDYATWITYVDNVKAQAYALKKLITSWWIIELCYMLIILPPLSLFFALLQGAAGWTSEIIQFDN